MPCRCEEPGVDESWVSKAHAATRAACDMRTIIRREAAYLICELTPETRRWIAQHDKEDAERIEQENREKIRENTRLKALEKLSLEERRVLGL